MRIFDSGEQKNRVPPSQTPEPQTLRGRIIDAIKGVYDPEIPVNLYDLGLIYAIEIDEAARSAHIRMTLTSPACPEAHTLPNLVRQAVLLVEDIDSASVELVWEPRWSREMMCDEAKLHLGLI
ncbi:MAG: DUF59 domain-containing protein [Phycisphaerales bacterium]|nr:DUF59 domain-containing protein [Phycisphaerales bacterium]